jgi:hypothetical protein
MNGTRLQTSRLAASQSGNDDHVVILLNRSITAYLFMRNGADLTHKTRYMKKAK